MKQMTQASLFCGAGGWDIGFERAGFKTIWANDFNADACDTFRRWSGAEVVCSDIGKIPADAIPDTDIILGGFPCQGFSLSGPRKLDDSRNTLYKHYVRIVKAKMPKAFVGENVKGLLTMGGGQIIDAIIQAFSDCGYDVRYRLLNAKNYRVPEDRQRVIIVGFRKDLGIRDFKYPEPSDSVVTLREALANVPSPNSEDVCSAPYSSRYMSRNRKRGWDDVSYTIPAMAKQVPLWPGSPDMVKVGKDAWRFGKGHTRRLSWQEAATIQTFPKDMEFCGGQLSVYRQIGNAVPCNLAEAVAVQVHKTLEKVL
jgi:DNA (cytosine-5)-methyltransferase 1